MCRCCPGRGWLDPIIQTILTLILSHALVQMQEEFNLQKPTAYHWDFLLLGAFFFFLFFVQHRAGHRPTCCDALLSFEACPVASPQLHLQAS